MSDAENTEEMSTQEAMWEKDQRADAIGTLIVFAMLFAGSVHYISGWTFDLGLGL
jgi:hypothetical protein